MMDDCLYDADTYAQSDLFAGIARENYGDIFRAGQHRLVASGATLFQEGLQALRCSFVRKGRLKLTKVHEEGKEVIIRYINPGKITAAVIQLWQDIAGFLEFTEIPNHKQLGCARAKTQKQPLGTLGTNNSETFA